MVDKVDEVGGGLGVGHKQKDLRPPILDVVFASVQHQQILSDLVEKKRLADAAPRQRKVAIVQSHDEDKKEDQRDL